MGLILLKVLLASLATMTIITIAIMCAQWVKQLIAKRLEERTNKKICFVDTKLLLDDYLQENAEKAAEVSMDELENLTTKAPYVAIDMDKTTSELDNQEGISPKEINPNFQANMEKRGGILVFE